MKSTLPPYLDGSVLRDLAIQTGSQVRSVRYASEVLGVAPEDIYTASQSWGRRQFDKQRRRALPRTFEPAAYQDVEAIVVEAARFIYTHSVLNGLTKCDALSQLSTSVLGFFMAITLEDTPFEQQVDPSQYNTIGSGAVCYHFREEKQGITAAASLDELTATLALRKYIYESTNGGNGFMPGLVVHHRLGNHARRLLHLLGQGHGGIALVIAKCRIRGGHRGHIGKIARVGKRLAEHIPEPGG